MFSKIIKNIFYFIILVILTFIVTTVYEFALKKIVKSGQSIDIIIGPGSKYSTVANLLENSHILSNRRLFLAYSHYMKYDKHLHPGHYRFKGPMSEKQIADAIGLGKVWRFRQLILEGWNFSQLKKSLARNPELIHDGEPLAGLQLPTPSAEGWFAPDTYEFYPAITETELLKRAYHQMSQILEKEWAKRDANLTYTSQYEALIVASLIERETSLYEEKRMVAQVILTRLKMQMRLQCDPTVIYALGDNYKGRLSHDDMKTPSPYNTYLHKGLPPTPISFPSRSSLRAALHPTATNYLYYVASPHAGHIFSENYEQHKQAVAQYVQYLTNYRRRYTAPLMVIWSQQHSCHAPWLNPNHDCNYPLLDSLYYLMGNE